MIGVGRASWLAATRSCHASWSSIREANATWWIVPAPGQRALGRRRVVGVEAAALVAAHLPAPVGAAAEAERVAQQRLAALRRRAVGAHALEALQRVLARDVGRVGDQRRIGRGGDDELVLEPFRVGEAQRRVRPRGLDPGRGQPLLPEVDRGLRAHAPDDAMDHAVARAAWARARVLEERQIGAGRARVVGVEEVVDGRIVLVDRLLHQPQSQDADVELHVGGRVAGDRGDVVDAFELHECRSRSMWLTAQQYNAPLP